MSEEFEVAVPPSLEGVRVDRAVALLTGLSRSEVAALVAGGAVSVDGRVAVRAATTLTEGQRLRVSVTARDDRLRPDPTVPVSVVREDVDFVVVDKAAGLVVHPGAGHREHTLAAGLLARFPEIGDLADRGPCAPERPGVVHRLDKGTSGLLVVARTEFGFASLSGQVRAHSMRRIYLALVEGEVAEDRGAVEAPIGRSLRVPTQMAVRGDGRPARTDFEVVARFSRPRPNTLLRLQLRTGRTHQIRVHLSSIGHPVVNDVRYGHHRDRRLDEGRPFLHSAELTFSHPRTGDDVRTTSDLPSDLAALVGG